MDREIKAYVIITFCNIFFSTYYGHCFHQGCCIASESPTTRQNERAKGFGKGVDCGKQLLYDIPIEEANRLLYGAND
ncbi:hypothetical protein BgAZ_103870 [Babesia gibsoni]|uniref:Uncharacterized protein n=1 Tax=Babesia gibsoni TaxID=33632 RepID=A0AAD8PFS9_BABGI|nr:hypothetical protein BgAZ_103870 [Babesia gibsoni]